MMKMLKICMAVLCLGVSVAHAAPMHGIAIMGEPALKKNFAYFPYVNPKAPKGGKLTLASYAGFDSLNPFIMMGNAPAGMGLTHDTLMKANADEPFTLYGLIAESIDVSADKRRVTFMLNPAATFNDGSKISSADVAFSFETLKEHGAPLYRTYYRDVERVDTPNDRTVVFYLNKGTKNRELPLILGQLPVLSKQYWKDKDFTKTTLEVPVSSGPYLIEDFEPNRYITYKMNPKYWAKDLNVNRGFYNFERIKYDTYRDSTVAVEALKSGLIDWRLENEAKKWIQSRKWDLVKSGKIEAEEFRHRLPSGMQGFVFNLRRPLFQDRRVREALGLVLDFDWINDKLFQNSYSRLTSFFDNSDFKAPALPKKGEKKLLQPYLDVLPKDILTKPVRDKAPKSREALQQALQLLAQAGWTVKNGVLQKDDQPFVFEILIDAASAPTWERIILPYIGQLKKLGIEASVKTLDSLAYKAAIDKFDYDMIVAVWGQSLSPGNEQADYWGSAAADIEGSYNYSGLKNAAVDALIQRIITAETRAELVEATQALDRVLLSEHIVIPHWGSVMHRCLYWNTLAHPQYTPLSGVDILTWWKK